MRSGHGSTRSLLATFLLLPLVMLAISAGSTAAPTAATAGAETQPAVDLSSRVRRIIADERLKGATIAVSVRDTETDRAIVSINDTQPLIPASNMKLLTTGAALHILGADFSFQTRMMLVDDDRLFIVGDGDPGFGDPELLTMLQVGEKVGVDIEEFLRFWVNAVAESGIGRISEVVIDDRILDREFVHPTWKRDQINRAYSAEVSGLIFHLNVLHFLPKPIPGQKPDVSNFRPYGDWIDLSFNRATSKTGRDDGNTFGIARAFTSNTFTFLGNVRTTYTTPVAVTVHNMPEYFSRLLTDRLRRAGVRVDEWRVADDDDPRGVGRQIGPAVRTPISTAITRCNTDSENVYAEALIKRMGWRLTSGTQPGSWENGAAAIRMVVSERLNDRSFAAALRIADGSGLSRDNRLSAALLTAWLNSFSRDSELGRILIASLAIGGENGTLRRRFPDWPYPDARVQAKSGYINGVVTLSGFITLADGRRRSFSILLNDVPDGAISAARNVQELIIRAVADDMMREAALAVELGG